MLEEVDLRGMEFQVPRERVGRAREMWGGWGFASLMSRCSLMVGYSDGVLLTAEWRRERRRDGVGLSQARGVAARDAVRGVG